MRSAACVGGMFCMMSQRPLTRSIRVYCHMAVLDYVVLIGSTSSDGANMRHGRYSRIIFAIRTRIIEKILVFDDLLSWITSMGVLPGRGWGG